jgi:hypothetical protein
VEDELMVKGLKEVWDIRPHAHLKNGRILLSDAHMGLITEKAKTLTVLLTPQATLQVTGS